MTLKKLAHIEKQNVEYQGEQFYITHYEISNGIIRLFTNKRTVIINEEDFNINDFTVLNKPAAAQKDDNPYLPTQASAIQSTIIGTNAAELTSILMGNIKKLQDDPAFIPQAEAINSQVKSIIDVAKAQVDALKLMKG